MWSHLLCDCVTVILRGGREGGREGGRMEMFNCMAC